MAGAWRKGGVAAVAVLAAAAWAGFASGTAPFSAPADFATAVPFAAMALVAATTIRRRREDERARRPARHRALLPYGAAVAVLVLFELATYFAGLEAGRRAFPTLSSLYDVAARLRALKALAFAAWVALGWGLFRR